MATPQAFSLLALRLGAGVVLQLQILQLQVLELVGRKLPPKHTMAANPPLLSNTEARPARSGLTSPRKQP